MDSVFEVVVQILAAAGGGLVAMFKAFKFVQEGERGIKLRMGKAVRDIDGRPRVIEPGFVLLIPFLESLQTHHVRQQTIRFEDQRIMIKEGLIFIVGAVVIFRIKDIYKALFEIDDLDQSLKDLSMGILRDEISTRDHTQLADTAEISMRLLQLLKTKSEEWGIEILQFNLINCAPTPETSNLVNVEIGAKLKMRALRNSQTELAGLDGQLHPTLAAVLVGMPLVATVGSEPPTFKLQMEK